MEVAAVLAAALEEDRREPVVVLGGRLAMGERTEDEHVVLAIADAPREGEQDVGVHVRRAALVEEQRGERLAVGLRRRLAGLRIEAARVLEVERRKEAQAVVAAPLLVVREERPVERAFGRRGPPVVVGADAVADPLGDRERIGRRDGGRLVERTRRGRGALGSSSGFPPPLRSDRLVARRAGLRRSACLPPPAPLGERGGRDEQHSDRGEHATMRRASSDLGTFSCEWAGEVLELDDALVELAIAEDHGEARTEGVRAAELRLDRGLARVDLAADAGLAHVASEHERRATRALADGRDDDVDDARGSLDLARDEQPLEAGGEADGGDVGPPSS